MLLECIRSYLKSVLRQKFILDTYHPDILNIREQGFEDPWLFFKAKRGLRIKKFGKLWLILHSVFCRLIYRMCGF